MITKKLLVNNKKHNTCNNNEYYDTGEIKIFGFWIYLMSDLILFACLFAVYVVLAYSTVTISNQIERNIFNLNFVLLETLTLLFSGITCGFASLAMYKQKSNLVKQWLLITFFLGLNFLIMEIYEFFKLTTAGYYPDNNAFLSAYFTLIGAHSIHVAFGLGWILIMIANIVRNDLNTINQMRLNCLSLFWHFLDIIWICVFTVVYLLGSIA